MENQEESPINDVVEGKITTFASPTVLAAILDDEQVLDQDVADSMVDLNKQEQNSEIVADSLDASLNDSLESSKLREIGELVHLVDPEEPSNNEHENLSSLGFTEEVSDFPKSSTPAQTASEIKNKSTEKAPKPRRSQHIIERNKEQVGKRGAQAKSSYVQMHAIKTRSKLDKMERKIIKTQENRARENSPGSNIGNHPENGEGVNNNFNENFYFENHVDQVVDLSNATTDLDEQENGLPEHSYLNGSLHTYQNHGPYYDVSANYSTHDSRYANMYHPVSYDRGYQSSVGHLRESHAGTRPVPPLHYNNLSTQSAPPGVYGYHRTPLISSVHHFNKDEYHISSVLSNNDFVNFGGRDKIPASSLHRKFSSEPYLAQSSSPSLQKITNVDRNSKASGSYSSLRQPFQYKPYTLKDYQNFTGSKVKPLAGGLGPNVDTDDFKEKMKKVNKQREYASVLRAQHSTMRKQQERKGPAPPAVKARHVKEAEIKRQAALNYAKNVPKPKQMASRRRDNSGSGRHRAETREENDQEITVLEILRMRHEQEKKEVDSIRKDLASKIRL